jgi:transcriptional regulator with XRE-family HTH domain
LAETRRSPTLRRRELGRRLRSLRLERDMTVEQVAEQLLCSPSKVSRMETGQRGATQRDMRDLCELYGVTDETQREAMMELAAEGRQPGWWSAYELDYFAQYVGLETAATEVWYFKALTMPGLLQTEDYVRALNKELISVPIAEREADLVEVRLKRQQRLTESPPLRMRVVLDEGALRRVVGGPLVMADQLDWLVEMAGHPDTDIDIQVVPFSAGANPAMESTFNVLHFGGPEPSVVYVEGLSGWMYLERSQDTDRYQRVFQRLREIALTPQESIEMAAEISSAYRNI